MEQKIKVPFSPPDITEEEADEIRDALLSGWITTGPRTREFERSIADFCNTSGSVCFNSATAAMEMALRIFGLTSEDEVIVPAYTYTATASSVIHTGARVKMVDCCPGSFEMDYDKLQEAITERTKVIMPVDIGGMVCDYDKVFEAIGKAQSRLGFRASSDFQEHFGRIIVLADCAHSFGSSRKFSDEFKKTGEIADFSAFSFHAVKNITTAEGGALTWRSLGEELDALIYQRLKLLSLHGQTKDAFHKLQSNGWEYDVVGAYYKANMTDLAAAMGLVQMRRYPEMLKHRARIKDYYDGRLKGLDLQLPQHITDIQRSNVHLYMVRLSGKDEKYRNEVIARMGEKGVASNVHFKPLPMMTAYRQLGYSIEDFPMAYDFYHNEITLPLYSRMTDEQAEFVMDCFIDIIRNS